MASRRRVIQAGLVIGSSSYAFSALAQEPQQPPVKGKDYTLVNPPLNVGKSPILVHDFFAYTCPHCLMFAPHMERFCKSVANDSTVKVISVPVAWNSSYELFPRTFYTFEKLGLLEKHHMPFWEWVIKDEHDWKTVGDLYNDIVAWAQKAGIDINRFKTTLISDEIDDKVQAANRLWKNYGIDSTPSVGLGGQYVTAPHLVGNRAKTLDVMRFLIQQIKERS